jgi:hypothetical protein
VASAEDLAKLLDVPADEVGAECERMVRRRELTPLRPLDLAILRTVDAGVNEAEMADSGRKEKGEGEEVSMTTANVRDVLGRDSRNVYRRCRRLESQIGLLRSARRKSDRKLYFFPVTGQVLSHTNHGQIGRVLSDLQAIAQRRGLPPRVQIPPATKRSLMADYRRYLQKLAASSPSKDREHLTSFERELIGVVSGTSLSDVLGLLGVRPFRPWTRTWRTARDGNPSGPLLDSIIDWLHDHADPSGDPPGTVYILPHRPPRPRHEDGSAGDRSDSELRKSA